MKQYIYVIMLALFMLFSCVHEDNATPVAPQTNITVQLTENDENRITTIDVLAFKVDPFDNTKEYFAYKTQGRNIADDGGPNKKKFTVSLLKGSNEKYRFVILANARAEVDSLGEITPLALKSELLKRLISHNKGKWNINSSITEYKDIPMWAESEQMVVNDQTSTISGIHLIRMLARVDVSIATTAQNTFKLKSVRVYNYNASGQIVPLTDATHWDNGKVLAPTIPVNPERSNDAFVYDKLTVDGISITSSIYLYEAAKQASDESSKSTCLVIGGDYGNSGIETFYRIDFVSTNESGTSIFSDLLRNYLYNVRITKVDGIGYKTPEEAFNAQGVNIISDVSVWEQGGLAGVAVDGPYMLGTNKNLFNLPLDAQTEANIINVLNINTNYPTGWSITKIVDKNNQPITWLSTDIKSGPANQTASVTILTQINQTEIDRAGYIHIGAGRLDYVVEVTQTTIPELGIFIKDSEGKDITELLFLSHIGSLVPSQQMTVTWMPENAIASTLTFKVDPFELFNFGSGNVITPGVVVGPNNTKTYTIQPPAMTQSDLDADPFYEKAIQVYFNVTNGVTYEAKSVLLYQKNLSAEPSIDANFVMDGSEQYFIIRANAPWAIEVESDPQNAIKEIITKTGGVYEDKREEKVYFKTNDHTGNANISSGNVTFKLRSTNAGRPFASKVFTTKFYSGEKLTLSNSYLIRPSTNLSRSYLIPVARANQGLLGSIGTNDKLEPYLVWTDNANIVSSNGNISALDVAGRGNEGYVYFYPGTSAGNTVVAVKVNDMIKWSWHIWSINHNPDGVNMTFNGKKLMNRNLGALSAIAGGEYSLGLFYQWGRKDPFPTAIGYSNTERNIYNMNGLIPQIPTIAINSSLEYTIQNPLTFLTYDSSWGGSAGANSWGNTGAKSIFDPCIPGWRIPPANYWSVLNTDNFIWDRTNKGRNHAEAGWLPASGQRNSIGGVLSNVGLSGMYWNSNSAETLYFNSSSINWAAYRRSTGGSVRCVKE